MKNINPKSLHHTYIVSGNRPAIISELFSFFKDDCGVKVEGNSDFFFKEYESFYIDDARDVQKLQLHRTLGERKFFVLSMREITHQAQNAFLKMAEDPTSKTSFFFVLPNHEVLLPTLKSRAVLIEHADAQSEYTELAGKFMAGTPKERFDIIGPFHPKEKEELDKEKVGKFLSALELHLSSLKDKKALHDVYDVKKKLQATGVSVKMLLEHLAMVLPFQK